MSGIARAAQLRLTEEVAALRSEIQRLEGRVSALEAERFEVVSSAAPAYASVTSDSPYIAASAPAASASVSQTVIPPLTTNRRTILEGIGRWLQRSRENRRQGSSGRDRLPESSTCYLVVRNFDGHVFDPVFVTRVFAEVSAEVKSRDHLTVGDSIFIGLPCIRDARIVVSAAGLNWPTESPSDE